MTAKAAKPATKLTTRSCVCLDSSVKDFVFNASKFASVMIGGSSVVVRVRFRWRRYKLHTFSGHVDQ